MSPPRSKFFGLSWLVLSLTTLSAIVILLLWLFENAPAKAKEVENFSQANQQEIPEAPKLTPAQVEFWEYLEPFNRLPENPTDEAIAVYNTKGIAPEFRYLKESKTSVLGDIKGLTDHRELFVKRYPWVGSILDEYSIDIPISTERFSGTAEEIGKKYEEFMNTSAKLGANATNEKIFVTNFLEGLLVVDYLYARGTTDDKDHGLKVIDGVFHANGVIHPFHKTLERKLLTPASMDIGWPIIADYPERLWALTPNRIWRGFFYYGSAGKVNFNKWMLKTDGIREMQNPNRQELYRGLIHNEQVRVGLLSYSIYTMHLNEVVRPSDGSGLIVIKILFKRLYPKDHDKKYRQYLALLDAAYPIIK